jgi:hypothetical protein
MISAAYLRQAEILIAMSRATFEFGVAARLRSMAVSRHLQAFPDG